MAAETSPATGVRAVFSYEGENHRIRVDPAHGFNALLSLVAARVLSRSGPAAAAAAVAAGRVRIKYREEDTGLTFVLGPDDDLHELFAAPRVWAVDLAPQVPGAAAPVRNQAPPVRSWRAVVRRPWHCQQDLGEHIFFISYRKASESTCAELLALKIEVELFKEKVRRAQQSPLELAPTSPTSDDTPPPHPFLDVNCLRLGESWEAGFVTGLTGSAIVILLCSDLGMAHMRRADREEDNVLLEWEIALELKQERGIPILPIFLSVPTPNGATPFSMFGAVNTFPDELHAHRLSPRRQTVRQTIQEIFALQGTEVSPRDYKRTAICATANLSSRSVSWKSQPQVSTSYR
ncbi:hypothetical protein DFJ73DRAFT_128863 [Zopfochytrium polystomum]|nr:hypothetical protein DFJ73DRAFT_128863 [Zopfochytrium polystomum]